MVASVPILAMVHPDTKAAVESIVASDEYPFGTKSCLVRAAIEYYLKEVLA